MTTKKSRGTQDKKRVEDELWIAPRYSLKGAQGERAWENRPGGPPNSQRMLEMADIALGLKKPAPKKKLQGTTHQMVKKEPYLISVNGLQKPRS
jgi:hypothetical protein